MAIDKAVTPVPAATPLLRGYRGYVLGLLTLVTALNFIDRQLIAILAPAIQADLKLEDWQLGMLVGLPFALLYTIATIPIARLADRTNKVSVVAAAVGLWSSFTALCFFAQSFIQLILLRVGVSIGEAGGTAPTHALLSDYFDNTERARALSIQNMGISIGLAVAFIGGGYLLISVGWRWTLVVMSLPGILIAILLKLSVREPDAGILDGEGVSENEGPGGDNDFIIMWRAGVHMLKIPTYRYAVIGMSCMAIVTFSLGNFMVLHFIRTFPELPFMKLMWFLGLTALIFNTTSSLIGGVLVDKLARFNKAWYGWIPAISLFLFFPTVLLFSWSATVALAMVWVVAINLIAGVFIGPSFALAQTLAPVSIRALSSAVFLFIFNLIGMGVGPTLTGIISSALEPKYGNAVSLQIAMSVIAGFALLGGVAYLFCARHVARDWTNATGESSTLD